MANSSFLIFIIFLCATLLYSWHGSNSNRHPLIVKGIIPLSLLLAWVGLIVYQSYQIEKVFTVLTQEYSRRHLTTYQTKEMYHGEKITGKFTANSNYLGIVGVRFWTFYRLNDDYLIFRIRQENQPDWYYQNNYKADQFQPNQYFTFGFPPIDQSAGRTFVYEIESTLGRPGMAVGLSQIDPAFIVKYKYPKSQVLRSPGSFLAFSWVKLINLVKKTQFSATILIYLLPLVTYLISLSPEFLSAKYRLGQFLLDHRRSVSLSAVFLGVSLDSILVLKGEVTLVVLVLIWVNLIRLYQLRIKLFFTSSLAALTASGIFYYLSWPAASERVGAWSLIFLVFTATLITLQLRTWPKKVYS